MVSSLSNKKVAVVTGSSSGIGYETALMLARNGFLTYATMRNFNKSENIKSIAAKEGLPIHITQLDVTDRVSINNAVTAISAETGRIDVLVNNAGYVLEGAFEHLSMDEIKAQYETNVFGLIRTTQAVLPIMREQKSGIIVNISSVAGRLGYPGGSAYISTKFAIEGLSESMSYELEPFGIKVVIIEPGVIRTNIFDSVVVAKKSKDPNSPYTQITQKMASSFEGMMKNASSPELVANIVLEAVTNDNPNLRYLAGKDAETWLDAKRNMSDKEFYKMMKQNLM
ncbi:SDR family oxidoreductase [Nitrososphaera sp. AFS]|uniref:SDR family oxidoreductase n=1 Tax=Nitrososphaera sp. AFS TaxID=2301191 RepID=UPI0013923765|nr:SDR family oxidoreductase [Nitrososphaera sp. AFS]NAL77847.1 SDR family oxidoreductase [Nitrososphaera sp. AFS]